MTSRLPSGLKPSEVKHVLGDPDDVQQATVAANSHVGLQNCFAFKIGPGEPYLLWRYRRGEQHFYVVFAWEQESANWRLSGTFSWPAVVDAEA